MQNLCPCLWFDGQAEDVARHYVSIFKNSSILAVTRYGNGMVLPAGTVLSVRFILDGQTFVALNGKARPAFTPAVSFVAFADTQEELDTLWARLAEGGEEGPCGWLNDRFGVSWQVVPRTLPDMLGQGDAAAGRVLEALMTMGRIEIATLVQAYETPGFRLRPGGGPAAPGSGRKPGRDDPPGAWG
jgi:predicted 3-demethylubiquinone-9 3-methyltransferase (glyoxalase superfamily)